MMSRLGIVFMRLLSGLPLSWVRGLGWLLGRFLFAVAGSRRRIALRNLALCRPQLDASARKAVARDHFVLFAQAWLDRSWLWHGAPATVRRRLKITGAVEAVDAGAPLIVFAPHFVGLDAGWTALTQAVPRRFATIYMPIENKVLDDWVRQGRQRFGQVLIFPRSQGVRQIAAQVGEGAVLYLLPDLDYGAAQSEFIDFFGVPAATVTSLSRFCRVARARAVTVQSLLTPDGYEVRIGEPWAEFPTADAIADTRRMNAHLEALIVQDPAQYLWTHRRFKTRPAGEPSLY
jgi:KDO2-lipid IV(A) lauroyltransferase